MLSFQSKELQLFEDQLLGHVHQNQDDRISSAVAYDDVPVSQLASGAVRDHLTLPRGGDGTGGLPHVRVPLHWPATRQGRPLRC